MNLRDVTMIRMREIQSVLESDRKAGDYRWVRINEKNYTINAQIQSWINYPYDKKKYLRCLDNFLGLVDLTIEDIE